MAANYGDHVPAERLYLAPHAATALVEDHLVLLDLRAGTYSVFDRIATLMWTQLISNAPERSVRALADALNVEDIVIRRDLAEFCSEQLSTGWLCRQAPTEQRPVSTPAPRYAPSTRRAWQERRRADRCLKSGFSTAYDMIVRSPADHASRRARRERVLSAFARAENFYVSGRAPLDCLPRSLALTRFLRCTGWPAEHVLGVRLYPFEAHAWVEVDGEPVNERLDINDIYSVIHRG